MLKNFNLFSKFNTGILNEDAPRIPNSEEYWIKKGKIGKVCFIYTHDDMDGIFSAIVMKNYLLSKGFEIAGYGVINYQEGWNTTRIKPEYINIAVDFAEDNPELDVYIDHHGSFEEGESHGRSSVKTDTGSAYEGICDQLGIPVSKEVTECIDMIDSAKYDHYGVDIRTILDFDFSKFKNKLEFAGALNQLMKRSDHKTIIEVIDNTKDLQPSIYNIYRLFRLLYPANNMTPYKLKATAKQMGFMKDGQPDTEALVNHLKKDNKKLLKSYEKDFIEDAEWRLSTMQSRTRGNGKKEYIKDQQDFMNKFGAKGRGGNFKVEMPGYQILGQLVFVPSGTWANALRIRAILEEDFRNDDAIPIINYKVPTTSKLYEDLKNSDGKILELVGAIKELGSGEQEFSVEEDVTGLSEKEGITGKIRVDGTNVFFDAKQPIFWMMLQYGNTIQVASYHDLKKYDRKYLPVLKVEGKVVDNLSDYCKGLLDNYTKHLGYDIKIIPNSDTVAGGHPGIGTVSNIGGSVKEENIKAAGLKSFAGSRFLDLFKNKMIQDLSRIPFPNIKMPWGDPDERVKSTFSEAEMDTKKMMKDDIRKVQDVQAQNAQIEAQENKEDE